MLESYNSAKFTFTEKKCPICHKVFFIPDTDSWAYKTKGKQKHNSHLTLYMCSWTCFQKYLNKFKYRDAKKMDKIRRQLNGELTEEDRY